MSPPQELPGKHPMSTLPSLLLSKHLLSMAREGVEPWLSPFCQPSHCAVQVVLSRRVSSAERRRQKGAAQITSSASSPGLSPTIPMLSILLGLWQPFHHDPKVIPDCFSCPTWALWVTKSHPKSLPNASPPSPACSSQAGSSVPVPHWGPSSWPVLLSLGTVAAAGVGSGDLSKCQFVMGCHGKESKMLRLALPVYPQLPSLAGVGIFRSS